MRIPSALCSILQLSVDKSSDLVMHMLVLYGNTGCKMDLSSGGYTAGIIKQFLPPSAYTPCIEEHNIHVVFRWPSIWSILQEARKMDAPKQSVVEESVLIGPANQPITQTVAQSDADFLRETGLTLSITTLGTCIYRFGKKRARNEVSDKKESSLPQTHYSQTTEKQIFKICKYVHHIVTTA